MHYFTWSQKILETRRKPGCFWLSGCSGIKGKFFAEKWPNAEPEQLLCAKLCVESINFINKGIVLVPLLCTAEKETWMQI